MLIRLTLTDRNVTLRLVLQNFAVSAPIPLCFTWRWKKPELRLSSSTTIVGSPHSGGCEGMRGVAVSTDQVPSTQPDYVKPRNNEAATVPFGTKKQIPNLYATIESNSTIRSLGPSCLITTRSNATIPQRYWTSAGVVPGGFHRSALACLIPLYCMAGINYDNV